MKKRKFGYKLSRGKGARIALFRSLIRSLAIHGSIKVTNTKAKAVLPEVEKLVKLAKDGSLAARRRLYARLGNDRETSDKLLKVAKVFADQKGGFVKITDLGTRKGDLARIAKLEWAKEVPVEEKKVKEVKKETTKKKSLASKALEKLKSVKK